MAQKNTEKEKGLLCLDYSQKKLCDPKDETRNKSAIRKKLRFSFKT